MIYAKIIELLGQIHVFVILKDIPKLLFSEVVPVYISPAVCESASLSSHRELSRLFESDDLKGKKYLNLILIFYISYIKCNWVFYKNISFSVNCTYLLPIFDRLDLFLSDL